VNYAALLCRSSSTKINDLVKVRIEKCNSICEKNNQKGMTLDSGNILFDKLIPFSVCRLEPVAPAQSKTTGLCNNCKNIFHYKCLDVNEKDIIACPLCSLKMPGIKWGIGLKNTCPLDAVLQLILLKCLDNKRLCEAIFSCKYDNPKIQGLFQRTIENSKKQNSKALQKDWAETACGNIGDDLFGTPSETFWNPCRQGGAVVFTETCTDCNFMSDYKIYSVIMQDEATSIINNISKLFQKGEVTQRACPVLEEFGPVLE